jgi:hypothetical protein
MSKDEKAGFYTGFTPVRQWEDLAQFISVLRLVGGPLVLSVFGRQHKDLTEVFLDVTSASTSVVGQQYSDGNIVSVLVPDPQCEAWFILQGSTPRAGQSTRPSIFRTSTGQYQAN